MLTFRESIELEQRRQELLSIIKNPEFRKRFFVLQGVRYWDGFSQFISSNLQTILGLIEEMKKRELKALYTENERLKRVTLQYRTERMSRDVKILCLFGEGKNLTRIAKTVGLTRQGTKKALKRLGV